MDPRLVEIAQFINNLGDAIKVFKLMFIDSKNDQKTIKNSITRFLGD